MAQKPGVQGPLRTPSLKTQTLVLVVLLVLLATGPLVWYYLETTAGLTELGNDPQIESVLQSSTGNAASPDGRAAAATALRKYGQISVLRNQIARQVLTFSLFYSVAVVLVSLVAGYYFVSRITRPLKRLTEAVQRIGEEGADKPLDPGPASGEVAQLVGAFNTMIRNLGAARQQLAMAERRATWQHVARTVAHEIKNPLTPIKLSTERLYHKYLTDSSDFPVVIKSTTATILAEIANLQKLVDTFHKYARFPDPLPRPVSINETIGEVAALFDAGAVKIDTQLAPALPLVNVDNGQLREALGNLVKNAVEAVEAAGRSDGRVALHSRLAAGGLEIVIADNGCGISAENQKRLFQPYFTTKEHGSGIGLALTERIITLNGGRISVESEEGRGTRMVIGFNAPAVA